MATKVKATTPGFYGTRRRAGDVFTLQPGHKPGKWMEVLGETKAELEQAKNKAKSKAKEPETFSEISKTLPTPKGAELV
jgi:hypothetical protein